MGTPSKKKITGKLFLGKFDYNLAESCSSTSPCDTKCNFAAHLAAHLEQAGPTRDRRRWTKCPVGASSWRPRPRKKSQRSCSREYLDETWQKVAPGCLLVIKSHFTPLTWKRRAPRAIGGGGEKPAPGASSRGPRWRKKKSLRSCFWEYWIGTWQKATPARLLGM